MNPESQITGVAIYLLGHGPYRSPRPIELQFLRINRYRHLLGSKYGWWKPVPDRLFVDINYPRALGTWDPEAFPSFYRLLEAVQVGQVNHVFFDVESKHIQLRDDYSWIPYLLKKNGAQPLNVFYDPDNIFQEHLDERFGGQAQKYEVTDASDFVAFYPALSAEIALAALDSVHHDRLCENAATTEQIWKTLYRLGDRSLYAAGNEPFVQEDLLMKWHGRAEAKLKEEWAKRRKHEALFRLGPSLPGLLLDESSYGGKLQARTQDELAWAERRVISELAFQKIIDGKNVSYVKKFMGYNVFADIRGKEDITFYAYKRGKKVDDRGMSRLSFDLRDRYTRELSCRWQSEFEKVVSTQ